MEKLISMVDYILHSDRFKEDSDTAIFKATNYANFLSQPLTLSMFVPVDDDGNLLSPPIERLVSPGDYKMRDSEVTEYTKAKERVLFEGFEIFNHPDNMNYKTTKYVSTKELKLTFSAANFHVRDGWDCGKRTIENLVKYGVKLTPAFQKNIEP